LTDHPDQPDQPDLRRTRSELRDGLETSREMVRRSHVLIELCESEVPISPANDNPAD
jgi:hypothetical protein